MELKTIPVPKTEKRKLWDLWTNTFYFIMCDTARIQGGRVTLELDEENLTGSLIYYGHNLIIDSLAGNHTCFAIMMDKAHEISIDTRRWASENHAFLFHLYDKIKAAGLLR